MNELIEILSGICSGEGFENSEDLIADGFFGFFRYSSGIGRTGKQF